MRRILSGLFLVAIVGVGGTFGVRSWLQTRANVVFLDNTYAHAVEVSLNGAPKGSIAAGQTLTVELDPGTYELVATGPSGELERGNFTVTTSGDWSSGFRGLYSLGGQAQYVVVHARYDAAGGETNVTPVAPNEGRFVELPAVVAPDGLDLAFPDSVTGSNGGSITLSHVCHFDPTENQIGCPNA